MFLANDTDLGTIAEMDTDTNNGPGPIQSAGPDGDDNDGNKDDEDKNTKKSLPGLYDPLTVEEKEDLKKAKEQLEEVISRMEQGIQVLNSEIEGMEDMESIGENYTVESRMTEREYAGDSLKAQREILEKLNGQLNNPSNPNSDSDK